MYSPMSSLRRRFEIFEPAGGWWVFGDGMWVVDGWWMGGFQPVLCVMRIAGVAGTSNCANAYQRLLRVLGAG